MEIKEKLNQIIEGFEVKKDGKVIFTQLHPMETIVQQELMYGLHGNGEILPNNFIYEKTLEAFEALRDYEVTDENTFENVMGEITDGMVPVYSHELKDHFVQFMEYADAAKVDNLPQYATILDCLSMGCYLHCMEILTSCWEFLNASEEEEQ